MFFVLKQRTKIQGCTKYAKNKSFQLKNLIRPNPHIFLNAEINDFINANFVRPVLEKIWENKRGITSIL